ncbi:MAG TPA: DUF4168 domain-containing protein [Gammaproteobacteria bacterium]
MHRPARMFARAAVLIAVAVGTEASTDPPAPADSPLTQTVEPTDPSADVDVEISDEDIETFAEIYVALRRSADKFEREIAAVESAEEAQAVQQRMQQESLETLERHGWTTEQFERVARALNRRPDLARKALQLIEEAS